MNHAVELMTHEELDRLPRDADAGFGALDTARGRLPLEAMDVRASVVGLDVRTEVRQTFVNTLPEPIEATYIFPLPDRGAVTAFRLRVGERVIEGVIDERGKARQDYDDAIRAGHRAAIAEEERPDVFTVRVGNLMPGQRASIELDLCGALALDRNEVTFRFPLVVAPRYIPGVPLEGGSVGDGVASDTDAVPDASRITPPVLLPGYPNPVRLGVRVVLDPAGLPLSRVRASLHTVSDTGSGERRTIALQPGERLDRDFVLRWTLGDAAVRTSLLVAPDADGPDASFALTVLPPEASGAERPRDVVIVLDRSGSMGGWKMVAARRAAARLIDSLCQEDRFAVLAFDDHIDIPPSLLADQLAAASDRNRFRAVEFLARVEARGGTEMAAPLLRAASLLGGGYADRTRILVLVTDGQVGNEDQILRELQPQLRGARVFPIGIDRAVNAGFLGRLADMGGAAAELVESEDRLDEVMERIQRRIGTPVVTELSLEADGLTIEPGSLAPRRLPDLLAGAPVVIRGRLRGAAGNGAIVVRGADRAGAAWQERVPARPGRGTTEASLWARGAIRDLEDRHATGDGDQPQLAQRIVALSKRFHVLSRFTAFLAVDRSETVNPGGTLHQVTQAVEPASGWDMLQQHQAPPAQPAMGRRSVMPAPMAAMPTMAAPIYKADAAPSAPMSASRARAVGRPAGAMAPPPKDAPKMKKEAADRFAAPPAERVEDGKSTTPTATLVRRVREIREKLAAGRGAIAAVPLALALLADLDAIAHLLGPALAPAVARVRAALRRVADGAAADSRSIDLAFGEVAVEMGGIEAALQVGAPPPRSRAFWK
jgi:Ca-activated chloride channel family protein